jgi:hypothetical protein
MLPHAPEDSSESSRGQSESTTAKFQPWKCGKNVVKMWWNGSANLAGHVHDVVNRQLRPPIYQEVYCSRHVRSVRVRRRQWQWRQRLFVRVVVVHGFSQKREKIDCRASVRTWNPILSGSLVSPKFFGALTEGDVASARRPPVQRVSALRARGRRAVVLVDRREVQKEVGNESGSASGQRNRMLQSAGRYSSDVQGSFAKQGGGSPQGSDSS